MIDTVVNVEKLAHELMDDVEKIMVLSESELSEYFEAQSTSCNEEWKKYKDKPEMGKIFSVLADGYKRAAEFVRDGK